MTKTEFNNNSMQSKHIRTRRDDLRSRVQKCGSEYKPKELFARRCDIGNKKKQWRKIVEDHLKKYGLDIKGLKEIDIPLAFEWNNEKLDKNEGIIFLFKWVDNDYRWKNENVATAESDTVRGFNKTSPNEETWSINLEKEEESSETEVDEQNTIFIPKDSFEKLTAEEKRIIDKIWHGLEDSETEELKDRWRREAQLDAKKLFESKCTEWTN